ncbi:MAG: hypothetical protein JXA77_12615 [Bacteroidales bacterium]|nr:hypothetical protein [Bacteroidales bacterium]MBN2819965.1 hypothetical protein [Bacteroidales bacterium]
MKNLFSITALAILIPLSGISQNTLDILTLSGKYTTPQNYDSTYNGKAQEKGSFIGLTLPIPINDKTIIYNSLNYFYFHVDNEADMPDNIVDPINLHGFIIRTGLVQKLNNGQSIQLLFSPRIMTDMQGGGTDNLQLGGLAVYEKKLKENLTMGFGAMLNNDFFGPYLVPLINLNWNISEKFSITGMLPVYAKINYKVSDKFTFGISHFGLTTSFGLNGENYSTDYIERQSIDLGLFAAYNVANNIYIEARIGKSMSRVYKQYAADDKLDLAMPLVTFGDNRTVKNVQFEDGMYCELRLIYRIKIPE